MSEQSGRFAGWPQWAAWGLFCALVVLAFWDAAQRRHPPASGPQVGQVAPDLELRQLAATAGSSSEFRVSAAQGHPLLLDFWATWCVPCKESLPILDQVYQRLAPSGLRAIAIETGGDELNARAFAKRLGLQLPIGLDSGEASARYGVVTIPHLVVVGSDGIIKNVFRGVHSAEEIERAVRAASGP
jgi:cytochrome c biogenesis protein CcmG/thiol:disulfide interchange protein DsbE